jgi:Holliday junction resolvasome RuvABC endonuclease subunit
MAILGIDQSLSGTGLSKIDQDGNLLSTKLVNTKGVSGVQRLRLICDATIEFCKNSDGRFVIAREGYSFGSKGRATFSLGELGGCIDLKLLEHKDELKLVDYYVLSPNMIKKFCFGTGAVKKDSSYLLKVFNVFGIQFADDNQADAFMIARTLLGMLRGRNEKDTEFFNSLSLEQKETMVSRSAGVTKAKVKKMEQSEFSKRVSESLDACRAFDGEEYDEQE